MRNNEQGRSMIEMLGVLAIVGVLSVGGIAGYSKAMNKFKANKLIDQVTQISTNVKTIFSGQRTFDQLSISLAQKVGALPADTYTTPAAGQSISIATNAFGGDIDVAVSDLNKENDKMAYTLKITDIPQDACITILTTDFGAESLVAMGVAEVATIYQSTDATANSIGKPGNTTQDAPFSVLSARTACTEATSNTIYFKFK